MAVNDKERLLKIAILLDRFLPSRGGERYFSFLVRELAKRGHEVHVLTTEAEESGGLPFKIRLLPVITRPRSLRILSLMFTSSRYIRREGFDIIHGVELSTSLNVYNPHGGVERAYLRQEFASIQNPLYRALKFLVYSISLRHHLELWIQAMILRSRKVRKIIAVSEMVKRDMVNYHDVESSRISVVFDSVDLRQFHPSNKQRYRSEMRRSLGLKDESYMLLFASNNYRLKGLQPLLIALARLGERLPDRSPSLVVVGRGRTKRYAGIARRLGIAEKVIFLGPVSGMEKYYAASDVYVHPTFYDSCALTILEALATGVPVVTTRFAGAADLVVEGVSGYVLRDPTDAVSLSEAIERCLQPEFLLRAEAAARKKMEEFSPEYNVEETLKVYREVVRERGLDR